MICGRKELVEALDKFAGIRVLVVGDIILDRYIWGAVERISPEAPVPVVEVKNTEDRLGGAANVVRNLTSLGAQVSLCGYIGDDDEGQIVLEQLKAERVRVDGVVVDRARPTSTKSRVISQGQQIVRIDRESKVVQAVALREGFGSIVESELMGADVVVISDYGKGAICEPVLRRIDEMRRKGEMSIYKRPLVVDPSPSNYQIYNSMIVAKPNRKQAEIATGLQIRSLDSALQAARKIMEMWHCELVVITLGEDGLVVVGDEKSAPQVKAGVHIPTIARDVFDVSGAGDTVTAILALSLGAGNDPVVSSDLANIGAGIAVSEVGTVAVGTSRLLEEIGRLAAEKAALQK